MKFLIFTLITSAVSFGVTYPKWGYVEEMNGTRYKGEILYTEFTGKDKTHLVEYRPLKCDWVKSDNTLCSYKYASGAFYEVADTNAVECHPADHVSVIFAATLTFFDEKANFEAWNQKQYVYTTTYLGEKIRANKYSVTDAGCVSFTDN